VILRSFGIRYLITVTAILALFANFVACGSQLYQVSMKDDLDEEQLPPETKNPTSERYGIHAAYGWKNLPVAYRFDATMQASQKLALQKAMQSWEKAVGKKLFLPQGDHVGVTGESFKDLYGSLKDGVNGHYLDKTWAKTAKPAVVLATTIWDNVAGDADTIASSDIRFNEEYYLIGDSLSLAATDTKEVVDMESLALHELGHLLGLAHVDSSVDGLSIMNPHLFIGEGLTTRKLSRGDIERIQMIYGCEDDGCDVDAVVADIEENKNTSSPTNLAH